MIELIASIILIVLMVQVFIIIYLKTKSLFKAWIFALIIGKAIVVVFWAFGIEHPLGTLYIYNKRSNEVISFEITSSHVIFLAFLSSLIISLFWYDIIRYAPPSLRKRIKDKRGI